MDRKIVHPLQSDLWFRGDSFGIQTYFCQILLEQIASPFICRDGKKIPHKMSKQQGEVPTIQEKY